MSIKLYESELSNFDRNQCVHIENYCAYMYMMVNTLLYLETIDRKELLLLYLLIG